MKFLVTSIPKNVTFGPGPRRYNTFLNGNLTFQSTLTICMKSYERDMLRTVYFFLKKKEKKHVL